MTTRKRLLFWILLPLFAAAVVWRIAVVPYQPERLYRMIPPDAVFVSHHQHLAERWDDFYANPLARSLFDSLGVDLADLQDISDDPETRRWLDVLLERDVVIAHVPGLGTRGEPAWILAGWIGGESTKLRWLLKGDKLEGFHKQPRHAGGTYWLVDLEDDVSGALGVAVVEGIIIGCYSEDPQAMQYVLDTYDGLRPSLETMLDMSVPAWAGWSEEAPDRGWILHVLEPGQRLNIELHDVHAAGLRGSLSMNQQGDLPDSVAPDWESPSRLMGGLPFFTLAAHPLFVRHQIMPWLDEVSEVVINGLLDAGAQDPVVLGFFGGEYSGSLMGLSVPSAILAWPSPDEAATRERIHAFMDSLNARHRWGLIASEQRVGPHGIWVVESTSDIPYADLRNERERMVFTWVDGWFYLGSHAGAMRKLLERYDGPMALLEADDGTWQDALQTTSMAAYAHADIARGARTLRLVLSAYNMKLLLQDARGSVQERAWLASIRSWLDMLEPAGDVALWAEHKDDILRLHVTIGTDRASEEIPE